MLPLEISFAWSQGLPLNVSCFVRMNFCYYRREGAGLCDSTLIAMFLLRVNAVHLGLHGRCILARPQQQDVLTKGVGHLLPCG